MKAISIELSPELLQLLETDEEAKGKVKIAVILDLVRRGKVSRAKAAELLQISLYDLPALLAQYGIPWFDYSPEDVRKDLQALRSKEATAKRCQS